jgi:cell wall-associated NlpC family hydrolase
MRRFGLILVAVFAVFLFVPEVEAPLSVGVREAEAAPYQQVVNNKTSGRFYAPQSWITSTWNSGKYGADYRVLKTPSSDVANARFKVKVPATGSYNVYGWWPADVGYNDRTVFRISTTDGWRGRAVSQRSNGGRWVKLGTYKLAAGDAWKVQVSSRTSGKGYIIADAVKIVRATTTSSGSSDGGTTGVTGSQIVTEARKYLGKPYQYGAAGPNSFDCSGFTQYVYKQFGINLPRVAADQYNSGPGTKVSTPRPGDLVFGHARGGSGIQHVGIISGDGTMIHAGNEQTDVEEVNFTSWYTVIGYKRIVGN